MHRSRSLAFLVALIALCIAFTSLPALQKAPGARAAADPVQTVDLTTEQSNLRAGSWLHLRRGGQHYSACYGRYA